MQKEKTEFPLPFLYYLKLLLLVSSMLLLCIWTKKWFIQFKQYIILIEKCKVQTATDSYTNTLGVVNINDVEKNMRECTFLLYKWFESFIEICTDVITDFTFEEPLENRKDIRTTSNITRKAKKTFLAAIYCEEKSMPVSNSKVSPSCDHQNTPLHPQRDLSMQSHKAAWESKNMTPHRRVNQKMKWTWEYYTPPEK